MPNTSLGFPQPIIGSNNWGLPTNGGWSLLNQFLSGDTGIHWTFCYRQRDGDRVYQRNQFHRPRRNIPHVRDVRCSEWHPATQRRGSDSSIAHLKSGNPERHIFRNSDLQRDLWRGVQPHTNWQRDIFYLRKRSLWANACQFPNHSGRDRRAHLCMAIECAQCGRDKPRRKRSLNSGIYAANRWLARFGNTDDVLVGDTMRKIIPLLFALLIPCCYAQTNMGPINTPQVNSTLYVGSLSGSQFYPTIQNAVTSACASGAKRVVDIPPAYTGVDPISGVTGGCTNTTLRDEHSGLPVACYTWQTSVYSSSGVSCANSTAVTGTAPVDCTTSGSTVNCLMAQATSSVDGYLSHLDWAAFNGKQAALTNPVTGTGTTGYYPLLTGASTIGNGHLDEVTTAGVITSTEPISVSSFELGAQPSPGANQGDIYFFSGYQASTIIEAYGPDNTTPGTIEMDLKSADRSHNTTVVVAHPTYTSMVNPVAIPVTGPLYGNGQSSPITLETTAQAQAALGTFSQYGLLTSPTTTSVGSLLPSSWTPGIPSFPSINRAGLRLRRRLWI